MFQYFPHAEERRSRVSKHGPRAPTLALLLSLAACAPSPSAPTLCPAGTLPGTTTTLYLGRGESVPDDRLRTFLADIVTPRFPGFTLLDAQGSWKGKAEPSNMLIVAHCGGDADQALDEVATAYATAFHQEAVGRTDQAVCQNFCTPPGRP